MIHSQRMSQQDFDALMEPQRRCDEAALKVGVCMFEALAFIRQHQDVVDRALDERKDLAERLRAKYGVPAGVNWEVDPRTLEILIQKEG